MSERSRWPMMWTGRSSRRLAPLAALLGVALAAWACGGGPDDGAAEEEHEHGGIAVTLSAAVGDVASHEACISDRLSFGEPSRPTRAATR